MKKSPNFFISRDQASLPRKGAGRRPVQNECLEPILNYWRAPL
jgi:hypothetical protein